MPVKRISRSRIWAFGIYINPDAYRYVALSLGPFWIYLYHQALSERRGIVGVDERSRYRVIDGERVAIEFYPWPWRRPRLAMTYAIGVLMWHIDMIRQLGVKAWNKHRKY